MSNTENEFAVVREKINERKTTPAQLQTSKELPATSIKPTTKFDATGEQRF